MQPYVEDNIETSVNEFDSNFERSSHLNSIIYVHSSVERLKITLHSHIIEMFSGVIDEAFIQQRIKIAEAHVKIGLEPKWYMCAFQDLHNSMMDLIEVHFASDSNM